LTTTPAPCPAPRRARIAFLHPVLGLGGAERWVVDAAVELQARGHAVTIFTAAHDPIRAFPETRDGRLDVRVSGGFLPSDIGGRLLAPCAIARLLWMAAAVATGTTAFDVVISDIAPYGLPLLRALGARRAEPRAKLVYYCHYPDQLLAPARHGFYRLYRAPLDALEGPAMKTADRLLVNSQFTAQAVAAMGGGEAEVVHPGVDVEAYAGVPDLRGDETLLLVVCRFDPRKNQALAIEALARLRAQAPEIFARVSLAVAGGLDADRREDRRTAEDLTALARRLDVADKVVFHPSPSEAERLALLARCLCVLHPVPDEHFGLVPVEAMAAGRPVIAVANAGPLETIVDGDTGFLRAATPEAFAGAITALARDPARPARMGRAGRVRAARFSRRVFGDALEGVLGRLLTDPSGGAPDRT
jgi:alpha-1,3/alpha-1,6-mannosyltransferase